MRINAILTSAFEFLPFILLTFWGVYFLFCYFRKNISQINGRSLVILAVLAFLVSVYLSYALVAIVAASGI